MKGKILKTLLESPKRTGEIVTALRYHERAYHNVDDDLSELVTDRIIRIIETVKKTVGRPGTTYDIVYNRNNLQKIFEEYPSLLPDLQKNESVINLILAEHKWFTDKYCETTLLRDVKLPDYLKVDPKKVFIPFRMIKSFHSDLKEKLQTSSSFFELFVNNSSDALKISSAIIIFIAIQTETLARESENLARESDIIINSVLDTIYETCVLSDMLNGDERCDKGIIYIIKMKKLRMDDYPF